MLSLRMEDAKSAIQKLRQEGSTEEVKVIGEILNVIVRQMEETQMAADREKFKGKKP